MGKPSSPIKMFISYSRQDMAWLERVKVHLKPLVREEQLDCWDDNRIRPGARWQREIEAALQAAQVALLLVSPDFYASDYIATEELPRLLAQAEAGGTRILVLLLEPSLFPDDPTLNCFMAVPDPKKTLGDLTVSEQNRALVRLVQEIRKQCDAGPTPQAAASVLPPVASSARPVANPYDPYHAVLPPLFVGRAKELRKLALCLDRRQSLSLVGDWRIGKSSLLHTWVKQARMQGRTVVTLNGQAAEGVSVAALVAHITGRACAGEADAWATQLDDWVEAQGKPSPVLVLDEADKLLKQDHRFWERMRGMQERCSWVLATRSEISEISTCSPFANQIDLIRLGLLDEASAQSLVALGQFSSEVEALMWEWAGKHPYYLQLIGYCLYDADGDEWEGLNDFQKAAKTRLKDWWNCLSDSEKAAMRDWPSGAARKKRSLQWRGMVDNEGHPFGRALKDWLEDLE